jgi:hypothetical protein
MNQQPGFENEQTQNGQRLIQRQTPVQPGQGNYYQQPQASKHRAGHYAGLQPEEVDPEDLEEDERYYITRPPTSTRRYNVATDGYMIKQGNKTFRYRGPLLQPPQRRSSLDEEEPAQPKTRRSLHWLVYVGIALCIMIVGWIGLTALGTWWQGKQDDWTYGNPRTYQASAVVGHNDSNTSPSHFIAENLRGQIIVIELPGGDVSKARSYSITTVPGNDSYPPVKLVFQDINRDGKPDMLIQIGDPGSVVTIMMCNNGTQFVSKL